MEVNNREFKVLTDREHVLTRPGMYLGQIVLTEKEQWIYSKDNNKFQFGSIKIVPALLKCASELIDNSIDVAIDTKFKFATKIQVNVDSKSIEVIDNGIGIPCTPPKNSKNNTPEATCACLAWTTLKSGTSFGDDRNKIGTNGVGSSCVNVFSKLFIGESDDGKYKQTITCKNNLSEIYASKVKKSSGKTGCRVYCEPDLERFGITEIDQTHIDAIYQRLVNLSICYPEIQFVFNKKIIKINNKKFAEMFSDNGIVASCDNTTVIVFPNEYDEFKFYANVNGIDTVRGGVHVDVIANEICSRIREKLIKKYKTIRPGDVKNKICMVAFLSEFANPEFDSQTKESLSNSASSINKHIAGKIDWDLFSKQILKNNAIIDPIVETFKIKEELKARQELKGVKKAKLRSDKYMPPIGEKKYLSLCEGQSAQSGISSCLGRQGIGYYAMRGLPINAYSQSIQKIAANQEFKEITTALNLDITHSDIKKTIDFEKILITTDNDADGSHLTSMLLGWFKRFAENLFDEGRICRLITPLILIKDSKDKIVEYFFNVQDFKVWEQTHTSNKLKFNYLKGLGSWERSDLISLIDKYGLDNFIQQYKLDSEGNAYIENWLGNDAEPRKVYLRDYSFDIDKA